jgi:hypothetical protein
MSLIKTNAVQIGQSPTATQNFTLAVPSSPDGTIKLARGNAGATTQDVLSVSNAGVVSFPQGLGNISNSTAIATGSTTARTLANRFADVVNVKDFLCDDGLPVAGNGDHDDTTGIQAAINAVSGIGGTVYLPTGTYKISAQLNISAVNISIIGTSQSATTIRQHTLSSKIFNISAEKITFRSLNIEYNSLATVGGDAFYSTQFYGTWSEVSVKKAYNAFMFDIGSNSQMLNFIRIEDCLNTGIYAKGGNNVLMENFFIVTSNTTNFQIGCIRLENQSEGHVFSNGQTFRGAYALTTDSTSYTAFQRPAYCKFTNVFFDSAYYGAWLKNCVEMDFTNCWFSNRPENGLYIFKGDGIKFNGGGSINSDKHGVLVEADVKNISFIGFSARGNSVSAYGTYSGITIAPNTNNFIVSNCILGENSGMSFGNQKYGLEILAGTSNNYVVSDNIVLGNIVDGIGDGGSGTNKKIVNNIGSKTSMRGAATIPIGSNSVTFFHTLNFTPLQSEFQLTPTVSLGFCGIQDVWVSSVTPTQATITANANATNDAFIAWSVGTKGA